LSSVAFVFLLFEMQSGGSGEAPNGKPLVIDPPVYETLFGEGASGSGFHFEWEGKRYIGCSLHQFEGKAPSEMISLSIDQNVAILARVHKQEDVQVLTYRSVELDALTPLSYDGDPSIEKGDPVVLYNMDRKIVGHVTQVPGTAQGLAFFRTEKPFEARGCSGAPVISGTTGSLIGVALTADDADRARTVGFEVLRLSKELRGGAPVKSRNAKTE
jgi:hypothetical protein